MNSIRRYILIYLGLSISCLAVLLILISNFYFDKKAISQHLDSIMLISALSFNSSIDKVDHAKLIEIENTLEQKLPIRDYKLPNFSLQDYIKNFRIQILNQNGEPLLHHHKALKIPKKPTYHHGFYDQNINGEKWRFLMTKNDKLNLYIIFGEKVAYRDQLIKTITRDDFYVLLLIFPLSILLIWLTVSKSLAPLQQITDEIKKRNPYHLSPVKIDQVPIEIQPLIVEINHLLARLQDALSREQDFAADAAHELRTPLAIIKTLSQTGIGTPTNPQIDNIFHKIIDNVDRGSHVIKQLMDISKTTAETMETSTFVDLDLGKICRNSLSEMTPFALEKNMDLELELDKKIPLIKGNKIALEILIRNLVDNSIRYASPDTSIYAKVYAIEKQVVLEIRDQGPGIPKTKQAKVFDRFYRAHTPKFHGSGLGLAIVKQIADLHQAEITLESSTKIKGLITRVFFPIPQAL